MTHVAGARSWSETCEYRAFVSPLRSGCTTSIAIRGFNPPGRRFARADGSTMENVHVGVQVRRDPWALARGDATAPSWDVEIELVTVDGDTDFRGPAVQGRRGERFVYLTWGEYDGERFEMFRRAKLMLADVPDPSAGEVVARVHLTDEQGMPRCARLHPPALTWP